MNAPSLAPPRGQYVTPTPRALFVRGASTILAAAATTSQPSPASPAHRAIFRHDTLDPLLDPRPLPGLSGAERAPGPPPGRPSWSPGSPQPGLSAVELAPASRLRNSLQEHPRSLDSLNRDSRVRDSLPEHPQTTLLDSLNRDSRLRNSLITRSSHHVTDGDYSVSH